MCGFGVKISYSVTDHLVTFLICHISPITYAESEPLARYKKSVTSIDFTYIFTLPVFFLPAGSTIVRR